MNRHIGAYRGKDNENNWHYGFLDFEDDSLCIHVVADISPNVNEPGGGLYSKYEKIDFKTIGQYTFTLGDQDIYEGDILEDYSGRQFWIKYVEENLQWEVVDKYGRIAGEPLAKYIHSNLELIGNIWDNPELVG